MAAQVTQASSDSSPVLKWPLSIFNNVITIFKQLPMHIGSPAPETILSVHLIGIGESKHMKMPGPKLVDEWKPYHFLGIK